MKCPECKEEGFKIVMYRAKESSYSVRGARGQSAIMECEICGHREVF